MNPVDKAAPMLYSTLSRIEAAFGGSAFQALFSLTAADLFNGVLVTDEF
jgi:hypothetical protein